jgi:hypothetical protein
MYVRSAGNTPLWPAPSRWSARVGLAAGITTAGLAAAACGGPSASVALPPRASGPTASQAMLAKHPQTPQQAITSAYQGYWQAYAAAMTASSPRRARLILAPYVTPDGLPSLIGSLRRVWRAHDIAYGAAVTHVKSVQITGRQASVHDCLDLSHFGVLNKNSGQVVSNSFGLPDQNYYVTLVRSGGRWRVSNMTPVEVPCTS